MQRDERELIAALRRHLRLLRTYCIEAFNNSNEDYVVRLPEKSGCSAAGLGGC